MHVLSVFAQLSKFINFASHLFSIYQIDVFVVQKSIQANLFISKKL
ncbi:MAG: hypothetical protein Q8S84_00645 [bacterium]|nr:hypothetical protein [bacterium]MDP3380096.1 hypothetical protein [bacterium]